jgi:hypothetical protein
LYFDDDFVQLAVGLDLYTADRDKFVRRRMPTASDAQNVVDGGRGDLFWYRRDVVSVRGNEQARRFVIRPRSWGTGPIRARHYATGVMRASHGRVVTLFVRWRLVTPELDETVRGESRTDFFYGAGDQHAVQVPERVTTPPEETPCPSTPPKNVDAYACSGVPIWEDPNGPPWFSKSKLFRSS